MVQETSKVVYKDIRDSGKLGELQALVYQQFLRTPGSTDREISDRSCLDINIVTARRNELVKLGYIKEMCVRSCTITGRKAIAWTLGKEDKKKPEALTSHELKRLGKLIDKANTYQLSKICSMLASRAKTLNSN